MKLIDRCATCKHINIADNFNRCEEIFRDKTSDNIISISDDNLTVLPKFKSEPQILCGIDINNFGCWFWEERK